MDVFGQALSDYFQDQQAETLFLHNSYDEPEEMPIDLFFRDPQDLPELENIALKACYGKVLDIGAGVGSHALILQQRGLAVTAIDHSSYAVNIMLKRGVKNALIADFFDLSQNDNDLGSYDTVLLLMNGIGITGTLPALRDFLSSAHHLLNEGGQILFDSSDIRYLYEDDQLPSNHYYGEVSYQYEYRNQKGSWFKWLYIDPNMLSRIAEETGWRYEMLFDDQEDQYLARLKKT